LRRDAPNSLIYAPGQGAISCPPPPPQPYFVDSPACLSRTANSEKTFHNCIAAISAHWLRSIIYGIIIALLSAPLLAFAAGCTASSLRYDGIATAAYTPAFSYRILEARVRLSGYKKSTLVTRIRSRCGLHYLTKTSSLLLEVLVLTDTFCQGKIPEIARIGLKWLLIQPSWTTCPYG
jgi:hypothetical protein